MYLIDLIDKCIADKTRCFINGMDGGIITKHEQDYIEFETLDIQVEKNTQKQKTTKEQIVIPIAKIDLISFGVKIETSTALDRVV